MFDYSSFDLFKLGELKNKFDSPDYGDRPVYEYECFYLSNSKPYGNFYSLTQFKYGDCLAGKKRDGFMLDSSGKKSYFHSSVPPEPIYLGNLVSQDGLSSIFYYKHMIDYYQKLDVRFNYQEASEHPVTLTDMKTYIIDPVNCSDADDAFSVDRYSVYVHITDITKYVDPQSSQFLDSISRGCTFYTGVEPVHMYSSDIVEKARLKEGINYTFTVKIDLAGNSIRFFKSIIKINQEDICTYSDTIRDEWKPIIRFTQEHRKNRINKGALEFEKESSNENLLKEMIAELAIISNEHIASYITRVFPEESAIFRNYSLSGICTDMTNSDKYRKVMSSKNASYDSTSTGHSAVSNSNYLHFTSPIRRASDTLIQFYLSSSVSLLSDIDLEKVLVAINRQSKKSKKLSHDYQRLVFMTNMKGEKIDVHIIQSKNGFINMILQDNIPYSTYVGRRTQIKELPSSFQLELNIDDYDVVKDKVEQLDTFIDQYFSEY